MDADQRVVEMRTHEDVVTNVSYEAAARIMAAQRKSEQLEHELRVTKDETVLKMLMDDKMMREANNNSQKQQEKIDELEAQLQEAQDIIREANNKSQKQQEEIDVLEGQLQEAEDIVGELRNELRYAQERYERVVRNNVQHVARHGNATSQVPFVQNRQHISYPLSRPLQSPKIFHIKCAKENLYLNQRTGYPQYPSQLVQPKNSSGKKLELPSIIQRGKKTNRIAQVIHASIPSQPEFTKTTELKAGNDKGYTGTMMNKGESAVGMSVPIVQEKGASTKPPYCEPKPTDAASEGPSLPGDKRVTEGKNASQRKKAKQDDSESSLSIYLYGPR